MFFVEIGKTIFAKHGNTYGNVCQTEMGDWVLNFLGIFSNNMKLLSSMQGLSYTWADEETKTILGIQGRDVKKAIEEMSDSMIEKEYVTKPKARTC